MADREVFDERFKRFLPGNCWLEKLCTGFRWAEGPVYFGDADHLLFSDVPNDRIMRWVEGSGVSLFRAPSHFSNGNTRDLEGRLVTCEHRTRRLTRTEYDGSVTVLVDRYEGKRFNSPNDVTVKSDGSIWFTDPTYGILTDYEGERSTEEIGGCNVYRLDPDGAVDVVADDFVMPNGIAFSPDESRLYVSDTGVSHIEGGPHHIRCFDVADDGSLKNDSLFAIIEPGASDGFRLDVDGNLWTSAGDGVHCYDPSGALLGKILVPETVSNLVFGGPRRNRLYITATTSLYAIYTGQNGAQKP